jgi:hypothetical protein
MSNLHTDADASCGDSWAPKDPGSQHVFHNELVNLKMNKTRLSQVVTVRMQTRMAQDAIPLQIPMVSQMNRQVVVQMQRSTIETGSMSRSVSSLVKKLQR